MSITPTPSRRTRTRTRTERTARTGRARAALVLSGALVVGAAAAAAVVPELLADPVAGPAGHALEPPIVTLEPADVALGCAAAPAATMGEAAVVDPAAAPTEAGAAATRRVVTFPRADTDAAPAELDGTSLDPRGPLRLRTDRAAQSVTLSAPPFQGRTAAPVGVTFGAASAGDLRGLVATPCALPQDVAWLVGGGSEVGESVQLSLRNVGETPATVAVSAYGNLGPLAAPSLSRIALAPGETTDVLIEGTVAPDPALALRVETTGGQVAAWGQWLRLDGLVPGGIASLAPAAPPATSQLLPSVAGTAEDPASVRLVNPGQAPATVALDAVAEDGTREHLTDVAVGPQTTVDVALPPDAEPALAVTSDVPVTAAAGLRRTGLPSLLDPETPPTDTAWAPAIGPRTAWAWALPDDVGAGVGAPLEAIRIGIVAPEATPATATLVVHQADGTAGAPIEVELAPGGTANVDVPLGAVTAVLRSDAPVAASALVTGLAADGEMLDVLAGTPDPHADQALRVDVR